MLPNNMHEAIARTRMTDSLVEASSHRRLKEAGLVGHPGRSFNRTLHWLADHARSINRSMTTLGRRIQPNA
ncbi:MAG TPA: hypothetical protein VIT63_04510 [Nitrospira sp.]